jgi:hypothetical protein
MNIDNRHKMMLIDYRSRRFDDSMRQNVQNCSISPSTHAAAIDLAGKNDRCRRAFDPLQATDFIE